MHVTQKQPHTIIEGYCRNVTCPKYNALQTDRHFGPHPEDAPGWCEFCGTELHPESDPLNNEIHPITVRNWIASQPDDITKWDDAALQAARVWAHQWRNTR